MAGSELGRGGLEARCVSRGGLAGCRSEERAGRGSATFSKASVPGGARGVAGACAEVGARGTHGYARAAVGVLVGAAVGAERKSVVGP